MNEISKIDEKAAVEQLPIGIHFGVPDDVYFGQNALGSTDKKELAIDPVEWQFKRLHGEDTNTRAKIWGSGLHARTLEGAYAFSSRFRAKPAKTAETLVTIADMLDWLARRGEGIASNARKGEVIAKVRKIDPKALVWDDLIERFEKEVPEERRVDAEMIDEINLAAEWMQADPMISPIMKDGTFQHGSPELTIIYDVRGVRCRARLDYLIPGRMIDLKRYSPWRNGNPLKGITQAIGNFRYDLQAADYFSAYREGIKLAAAGKVFGNEPYGGFVDQTFGTGEDPKWVWVFIKGEGAPQPRVVELPTELTVFKVAQDQIEGAIENYRKNVKTFGLDRDWAPIPGAIHLDDSDFPAWFGNN